MVRRPSLPRQTSRTAPACRLRLESLEDRQLLATFGTPWPEPRSLSVSFPSDEASLGGYRNSLRAVLDQVADRQEWQAAVLRAFQTWAVQANLNIGLVPDRGDAFGAIGLASNDPRFGELRVGVFPQPGILASALPFQTSAGTWSGDVLLNSQAHWFLADPQVNSVTVPPSNERGPAVELFTVLLHEAGNALGIADTSTAGSVMYTDYQGPLRSLTASDIQAVRRLYGPRRDVYEATPNNTRATATRIVNPPGFLGDAPLSQAGSLNSQNDTDFYRFTPLAGREKVKVRLWAAGISLVQAKLEVLDRFGAKIGDVKADSIFDNNLELEVSSLSTHRELWIKVSRNTADLFAIGDYRLELDYRPAELQPSIHPLPHDADAEDEDSVPFGPVSLEQLFGDQLLDRETGANETLATATPLETPPGFLPQTRYELPAAIAVAGDRDLVRIQAPAQPGEVLSVQVHPLGTKDLTLDVVVLNAAGDRVEARVRDQVHGGRVIQISNPAPHAEYVIGIWARADSVDRCGSYVLTADFATERAELRPVAQATVAPGREQFTQLQVHKPQLFRFDLFAQGESPDAGVQVSFYDARTRDMVFALSTSSTRLATEYVWLPRGEYVLLANARSRYGQGMGAIEFQLLGDAISDDQGPNPIDPTQSPADPTGTWDTSASSPGSPPPVLDLPTPVAEDPWLYEELLAFVEDYYSLLFE